MDTTYDDLTKGRKHEIVVQVLECKPASRSKRAYELTVEDINGTDFDLVIWEKSNVGRATDWSEGVWYRLGGITVNEWDFGKVAHGTSELTVEQIGHRPPHTPTNIVYGTDSHLGKSIHSYGKGSWTVNPEDGFSAMVDYAVDNDVDAVVHGGDLFHNPGSGIDEGDILSCQILLHELANSGIPFYFIYGNHERDAGRQVMQELINDGLATHLGYSPVVINDSVAIYGIDWHSDWESQLANLEPTNQGHARMLCLHQSLAPFTGSKIPDSTLDEVATESPVSLDLIITGHTHTRGLTTLGDIVGVAGGATARVGETQDGLSPSVEILTFEHGQFHGVERESL